MNLRAVLIFGFLTVGPAAFAAPYSTQQQGGHVYVVRSALPAHGPQRIQVLKQAMKDEILAEGGFKQQRPDTPAIEIISHGPALKQTGDVDEYTQGARYEVSAAQLSGGKLKVTLLMPVSGHLGVATANQYKASNRYNLWFNGGSLGQVASQDYVTEHVVELTLKPGRNLLAFSPSATSVGGYKGGREIEIDLK